MPSFGQSLRYYRRQCRDPIRGGLLTQERLGELMGDAMGDSGYSGAAISDWERDKSKINADERLVLVSLVKILHQFGGLSAPTEADELLSSGNYRGLNNAEQQHAFPKLNQESRVNEISSSETPEFTSLGQIEKPTTSQGWVSPTTNTVKIRRWRRKQLLLLNKVKNFWVDGLLQDSVDESTMIRLSIRQFDQAIQHPWQGVNSPQNINQESAGQNHSILEHYFDSDRALLILGEPGSGKTVTLMILARDLISRAEHDHLQPVPVILNLVSWAEGRPTLDKWVVEELASKYQIPRKLGANWLQRDELTLLLDGLDEVPDRLRPHCIKAINNFRETRGLSGIVVCSRSEEYRTAAVLLKFGGAILLESLSPDQIDAFLAKRSSRLTSLRAAVKGDPNLGEMARSPLMLSIMSQAYSHSRDEPNVILTSQIDPTGRSLDFWRRHLFETYVENMLHRRATADHYSSDEMKGWLAWLARNMFDQNRSQFLLEQLQPSWLINRRWRWTYMMLTGLILGSIGGIIMWLFLQLLRESNPYLPAPISETFAAFLQIAQGRAEFLALLIANITLGLVVALLQGRFFEAQRLRSAADNTRWIYRCHLLSIGAVVGLLTIVVIASTGPPELAIVWAISEVILFVTAARYIYGRSYQHEIRTVEALSWSWPSAARGLIIGLLVALIAEVLGKLLYKAPMGPQSSFIIGSGFLILGGLRGRRIEAKSRPNQGILLSFRNSFIAASISCLFVGLITGLVLKDPSYALLAGALTFITAGSLFGGNNVVKHILVRFLLWFHGDIPWRYAEFLDYGSSLAFLRKVGGSYIFMHGLLQTYFATLKPPPANIIRTPVFTRPVPKSSQLDSGEAI